MYFLHVCSFIFFQLTDNRPKDSLTQTKVRDLDPKRMDSVLISPTHGYITVKPSA